MRNKINFVLLIDDDRATNFFNSIMINKHDSYDKVHCVQSGYEAIEYLENIGEGNAICPDLIFLDINMPGMNGWDFLTQFDRIKTTIPKEIKIVLLSTSSDPDEVRKSMVYYTVDDYICKPLSKSLLTSVSENHFKLKIL